MADGDGGSIINVSTIGSLRPALSQLVYSCAKAGLNALTIGLAAAYGPKVRSNAILPGEVLTDIARPGHPSSARRWPGIHLSAAAARRPTLSVPPLAGQ